MWNCQLLNNFILKSTLFNDRLILLRSIQKHAVLNHGENNERRHLKIRLASDIAEALFETLFNGSENGDDFCLSPAPFDPAFNGEFGPAGTAAAARRSRA
jgi:hypothetical protein